MRYTARQLKIAQRRKAPTCRIKRNAQRRRNLEMSERVELHTNVINPKAFAAYTLRLLERARV